MNAVTDTLISSSHSNPYFGRVYSLDTVKKTQITSIRFNWHSSRKEDSKERENKNSPERSQEFRLD